jgi:hypothetical protein
MATLDELAAQFGGTTVLESDGFQEAPPGVRVPWANLPPKKADEARLRAADYARKKIDANSAVVTKGREVLDMYESFGGRNRQTATGGLFSGVIPQVLQDAVTQ